MAESFPLPPRLQALLDALPLADLAFTSVPVPTQLAALCRRRTVTFVTFASLARGRLSGPRAQLTVPWATAGQDRALTGHQADPDGHEAGFHASPPDGPVGVRRLRPAPAWGKGDVAARPGE